MSVAGEVIYLLFINIILPFRGDRQERRPGAETIHEFKN